MDFKAKSFKKEIVVSSLFNLHYFEFTSELHTTKDSHGFCELVYVERGKINIESESYVGELREGELILHTENQIHSLSSHSDHTPNIIIVGFECKAKGLEKLTRPLPLTVEMGKMLVEIVREGRAVYLPPYDVPNVKDMKKRSGFNFGADQLIKNLLEVLLIKCLRHYDRLSAVKPGGKLNIVRYTEMEEVKKYLDSNFHQKIRIEDLCFLFNTNKTTLSAKFKDVYGVSIIEYINKNKIEYAKQLLTDGTPITEITDILNLSSVHYLTSLFKRYTGRTPSEYRRSMHTGYESK